MYYSLDGFTSTTFMLGLITFNTDNTVFSVDPFVPFVVDATSPVMLRLYAYGATSGSGTFSLGIDSGEPTQLTPFVQIRGDVSPAAAAVPEPMSLLLLGTGTLGLLAKVRRNRQQRDL
jgi:hypothetical protein